MLLKALYKLSLIKSTAHHRMPIVKVSYYQPYKIRLVYHKTFGQGLHRGEIYENNSHEW